MKKNLLLLLFGCLLGITSIQAQTETEPNNTFKSATLIMDNTLTDAVFSSELDVDIFKMNMTTDSIYHIYSADADMPDDVHVELFFEGDTTLNILNGDPDGRATGNNFRIAGWVPNQYGSGVYYLKLSHTGVIGSEYTGEYKVKLITQTLDLWAGLHEPDNSFQEAFGQFALPIDGTRFNGMLYNPNDLPTGKDDIDIFYMAGEQGKRLWVETEPVQGYPNTRDMDSKIFIYDGDGNELLEDNDDKSNQEEDFGSNNVFSLAVIDSLPYDGLYYVIMTSYYSAYNHDNVSDHSDENPATGGYTAFAWMGETKVEIEPNNDAASATAVCEAVSDDKMGEDNNLVIDANFSGDGDVDYYAVSLKTTKMYTFTTANSSIAEEGDVEIEIYKKDDPTVNLIDATGVGKYNDGNPRISGWIPPSNGIYLVKLSPTAGSVGGVNTGDYEFRMGWATWRSASLAGELDNNSQTAGESNMVEYDSSKTYAAIYPAADEDWYWFEGNAGDVIDVELFSGIDKDGLWGRDLDTKIALVDPDGSMVENDDYRPGEERHDGNTFSAVKGYSLKATGKVWIKVEAYYKDDTEDGKNAIGTYKLIVHSSAASPAFSEKELNDTFETAMKLPEGKEVISKFSKAGVPSADDIDIFSITMSPDRMYFINSTDSDLSEKTHVELFSASDTETNLLNGSIDGRYQDNNFRLAGYIPTEEATYYLKLTNTNPGGGTYTIRARSVAIADVGLFNEPNNTNQEADARGDASLDGVPLLAGLYAKDDPTFANDLDIYRISGTAGQMFVAELKPAGGPTWNRDVDTKMQLKNAAGEVVAENDDFRIDDEDISTYSKITTELPETGVYYLNVYGYYSSTNGKETSDEDPGVGDYLIKLSGTMSEVEPNNSAAEANVIPIADNNLIEATFGATDLEDWYKVSLDENKLYYFSSTDSKVAEDIIIEIFAESDLATNLIDTSPMGGFSSSDFRVTGWKPPSTGNFLLKLSIPVAGINDQNTGKYKLRAAGGEVFADLAQIHEPDNSFPEADAQDELSTDSLSAPYFSAFTSDDDHDVYVISGTQGESLEVKTIPGHGPRWIRELDTKIRLFTADSVELDDNDDWDDWYELNYYLGEVSNVYSRVKIDSLPYTGKYYIDVFPYYGTYNGKEPEIGKSAVGSYKMVAVAARKVVGVEKIENVVPSEFGLAQNYPNPFNPSTTIQYNVKEPAAVSLSIYNILGQKVITLVNKEQLAGKYEVNWNSKNEFGAKVSTGIYFYRLVAGNKFTEIKKMILLK